MEPEVVTPETKKCFQHGLIKHKAKPQQVRERERGGAGKDDVGVGRKPCTNVGQLSA